MMTALECFANNVKALRLEKGWGQLELAQAAGLSTLTICRLERKLHAPSIETARMIAIALDGDLHSMCTEMYAIPEVSWHGIGKRREDYGQ